MTSDKTPHKLKGDFFGLLGTSNRKWFGSTLTKNPDTYVQLSFKKEFVPTQSQQRPQNAKHQVAGLEPSKVCLRRVLPEEVFTHEVQLIYSHVLVLFSPKKKCWSQLLLKDPGAQLKILYVLQNHWLIYWKIPISGIRFSQIGRWDLRSKIGMKIPHNRRRPWIFGKQTYWKIHPGKQTAGWNSKIRGLEDDGFLSIEWFVPATSKGCQLNSKGWWIDTR